MNDLRSLFRDAASDGPADFPTPDEDVARGRRARTRRRRRRVSGGVGAVLGATAAALLVPISPFSIGDDSVTISPASGVDCAADEINPKQPAPRFLPDDPGWTAEYADESSPYDGEVRFVRGSAEIEMDWGVADEFAAKRTVHYRRDAGLLTEERVSVLGCDAMLYTTDASDRFEAHVLIGSHGFSIDYRGSSADTFSEFVQSLGEDDKATWAAAMPDDYILMHENSAVLADFANAVPMTEEAVSRAERQLNKIDPDHETALLEEGAHWAMCGWVKNWILDHEKSTAAKNIPVVRSWAVENDAVTEDEMVWDYAEAIEQGRDEVDGEPWNRDHAADIRCGGF